MQLDANRNTARLTPNIYSRKIQCNKSAHAHNLDQQMRKKNFFNTLYRLQHVCKPTKSVNIGERENYKLEETAYRFEQVVR